MNAWNANAPDWYDRFCSPGLIIHGTRGDYGLNDARKGETADRKSFSDLRLKWEFVFAAGDMLACRYAWTGTHDGMYQGNAPTGKHFEAWAVSILRIENGKVTEEWFAFDQCHRLQQLGIIH